MRLATAASLTTLLVTALLAGTALWQQVVDQSSTTALRLLVASAALTAAGFTTSAAGKLFELRHRRELLTRQWHGQLRRLLAIYPNDALPRLSQLADEVLGPTPTRYTKEGTDTYVPRPLVDKRLREALSISLAPYEFVVLDGDSKSGKSRTAVEGVRSLFNDLQQDPIVIIPRSGEALAELVNIDPPLSPDSSPGLVWLDDLSTADLTALTGTVLDLVTQHSILVATITTPRRNQLLHSTGEITATARHALRRAIRVEVPFDATGAELAEARHLYPSEEFHSSIAETLVAGEQLLDKQRAGRQDNPAGHAIVQAAVDIRRIGITRPITETELRFLFPDYLQRVRVDLAPSGEQFTGGLKWAAEPITSQVALLRPTELPKSEPRWEVFDYVVSADDGQRGHPVRPIPEGTWGAVLDRASVNEVVDIAIMAHQRDRKQISIQAFGIAAGSGDEDIAPRSAGVLGVLLAEQGDVDGAHAALQQAVDSGHPYAAPHAAVELGDLLYLKLGDVSRGRAVLQHVLDAGDPDLVPRAALTLGLLHSEQNDPLGARAFLQLAIDSNDPEFAPRAAGTLGLMLLKKGDLDGARAALVRAVEFDNADVTRTAAHFLGDLLSSQGDLEEALAAYQRVLDSDDADDVMSATYSIAGLRKRQGEFEAARAAYQRIIDSGHPETQQAALSLGLLLVEQGDSDGARVAFQQVIDSEHLLWAPIAVFHLGLLLVEQGDSDGARVAFQQVIDSNYPGYSPRAAVALGDLLVGQGDLVGARAAYQWAIDTGDSEVMPAASAALNQLDGDGA